MTRKINLFFDGENGVINAERIVAPDDLIRDIEIACKRKWIKNDGLSNSRIAKCKAIESSMQRKNY